MESRSAEFTASRLADATAFKEQVRRHCEQRCSGGSIPRPTASPSPHGGTSKLRAAPETATTASPRLQRPAAAAAARASRDDAFGEPSPIRVHPHLKIKVSEVRRSADCRHQPQTGFEFAEESADRRRSGGPPIGAVPRPAAGGDPLSDDAGLAMFSDRDPFPRPPPPYSMIPAVRRRQQQQQQQQPQHHHHHEQQQQQQEQQPWSTGDGITVSPSEFRVDLVVAGYGPEELEVEVEGGEVVVRGRHAEAPARPAGDRAGAANVSRHFSRRYALPVNALADRASVVMARGATLSIRVPRQTTLTTAAGEGGIAVEGQGQGWGAFTDLH